MRARLDNHTLLKHISALCVEPIQKISGSLPHSSS
jgi:hypothetical protein